MKLPYGPAIPLLGMYPDKPKTVNQKKYTHPYVQCSIIHNSQDLEATQVPISRWVDKKAVVYLHDGILVGYKKKEIPPFVTAQMDL